MPFFILASSSPRRRELLGSLGIPFTIIKPDIDETQHPGELPLDYVSRLSREKAQAVADHLPHALTPSPSDGERGQKSPSLRSGERFGEGMSIILAADTVVILGADTLGVDEHGAILGKPVDADDALDMLQRLRGRTHQVCTAMTLLYPAPSVRGERQRDKPIFVFEPSLEFALTMRSMGLGVVTHITTTHVTMRDYSDAEIDAYIATGDPFDKAGSYAIQHPVFKPVAKIDGCYTNVVGLPLCTLKNMLAEIGWPGIQPVEGCDCATSYPGE